MKDPSVPSFVVSTEQQIDITIATTDAIIVNQGYTYNQPGFTYNQPGVLYGGIAQPNQDLAPVFFDDTAYLVAPSISGIIDIYSPFVPDPDKAMLIGILGMTYP